LLPEVAEEPHSPYIGILKSKAIKALIMKDYPNKSLDDLRSDVDFALSDEYMIRVTARDKDPATAAGIANGHVTHFNHLLGSYSESLISRNEVVIRQQLQAIKDKLRTARAALNEFQEKNSAVALEQQKQHLISQELNFKTLIDSAKIAQKENQSNISALKAQMEKEAQLYISSELIVGSPLTQNLRSELSALEIKMAAVKADIKELHPDFIRLEKQHKQIQSNLSAEIERMAKSQIKHHDTSYEVMRRDLVRHLVEKEKIMASLSAYNVVLDEIKEKISAIPGLLVELDTLAIEVEKYRGMMQTVELKLQEATMQKQREPQAVVMVEKAVPPSSPSYPIVHLNIIVAGMLGLIAGVFYCFFMNYLEETRDDRLYALVKAIEITDREQYDE
jgi:uncharacterized protein involved in exopolysaccharide biosynthesis